MENIKEHMGKKRKSKKHWKKPGNLIIKQEYIIT